MSKERDVAASALKEAKDELSQAWDQIDALAAHGLKVEAQRDAMAKALRTYAKGEWNWEPGQPIPENAADYEWPIFVALGPNQQGP